MTPKAHPELAGQGVEYSWGYSKFTFRRANTGQQKSKQLRANVLQATSATVANGLNIERVRKFVRKARDYKVLYREHSMLCDSKLAAIPEDETPELKKKREQELAHFQKHHYSEIEKQMRTQKCHRCAADFATKFTRDS